MRTCHGVLSTASPSRAGPLLGSRTRACVAAIMPKKPAGGPVWGELLGGPAAKDVGAVVQSILWTFDAVEAPEQLNAEGLVQAIGAALQSPEPQRVLVGSVALLIALAEDDGSLLPGMVQRAGDTIYSGLGTALTSGSPLTAAAATRGLCALIAVTPSQGLKDERHDKQARSRKITPQLRAALEAHPKSVQVQEALAAGCCTLLAAERAALGGHVGALWAMLWPLMVHPRDSVAKAAELCLCRLTWLAQPPGAGAGGGSAATGAASGAPEQQQQQQRPPSVEEALARACNEFDEVFQALVPSVRLGGATTVASQMAQLQSVRLLSLACSLLRYGRSAAQAHGRRDKVSCLDDVIVVVPVAKLVNTIEGVITAVFSDSAIAARVLGDARGSARGLAVVLAHSLELAAVLAEVAGVALLPQASRLRRWLEVLVEVPPSTHWRHCRVACRLVHVMAQVLRCTAWLRSVVGGLRKAQRRWRP